MPLDLPVLAVEAVIDGRLDDAVWGQAPLTTGSVAVEPKPGLVPTNATEVRVYARAATLLVGVRAFDSEPTQMRAGRGRRDGRDQDDRFMVGVTADGDAQRA